MTDAGKAAQRPATAVAGVAAGETVEQPVVRFHEASSPFNVARDLRVNVTVKRKDSGGDKQGSSSQPPRPGEDVEVLITTTDPQGKPVAAELSLAMIEQSLLDRFPGNLAAIQDFFQAGRRQAAVRTTSSITFAYNPATQPINPRLLAEEDRLALAAAEDASRRGFAPEQAMGRLTESLRTGVTPRIINQEEEEERIFTSEANDSICLARASGTGSGRACCGRPTKPTNAWPRPWRGDLC